MRENIPVVIVGQQATYSEQCIMIPKPFLCQDARHVLSIRSIDPRCAAKQSPARLGFRRPHRRLRALGTKAVGAGQRVSSRERGIVAPHPKIDPQPALPPITGLGALPSTSWCSALVPLPLQVLTAGMSAFNLSSCVEYAFGVSLISV